MGIFTARSTADLASVGAKLEGALAKLPALERRVQDTALAAVLSDDTSESDSAVRSLRSQRDTIERLRYALTEAERLEHDRLQAAREAADRARSRAFKAHLARLASAAVAYETAVAAQAKSWQAMTDAASSARALLPALGRDAFNGIFEPQLFRLGETELARQGRDTSYLNPRISMPGSLAAALAYTSPDKLPPISEELARIAADCGSRFGRAPGPVEPAKPDPVNHGPVPGSEDWTSAMLGKEPAPYLPKQEVLHGPNGMTATITPRRLNNDD